jgi:hypothetical protein
MLMCCVCAFSLSQESPDIILEDEPLISEVVLSQAQANMWANLTCGSTRLQSTKVT